MSAAERPRGPVAEEAATPAPSFRAAFWFWLKLGFISFGGPAGQIAVMHQELVEKRRWISENRFLHALNYCMVLPGPEAQQLATYIGWLLHQTRGGVVAGGLFVLPSLFILVVLSWIYLAFGNVPLRTARAAYQPASNLPRSARNPCATAVPETRRANSGTFNGVDFTP